MRVLGLFATVLTAAPLGAGACTRAPAPEQCPDVSPGDLVLTEIRGTQKQDALGVWVEIYNASGGEVDLIGTRVVFRKLDGSGETHVLVRRSLAVGAGAYVTLGLFADDDLRPAYVDYGFAGDYPTTFLTAGAVQIEACATEIDKVVFDNLPAMGTYSLGTQPPSADANDLPAAWCTDATMTVAGYPGSPQQANIACP